MDTFLGEATVRFTTDTFTGEVVMHCHFQEHADEGCMAHMYIVDDKAQQPWGYCLHGAAMPGVAALSMSVFSALLAWMLALAYICAGWRCHKGCCASDKDCCASDKGCCAYNDQLFGRIATALMVPLYVTSVIPLIHDDGHSSSSLVARLHANENSYLTFLPLHVAMMLLVLVAATWLVYARTLRARSRKLPGSKTYPGKVAGAGAEVAGVRGAA